MPMGSGADQAFALTIELRRVSATLRGTVRFRAVPSQMEIEFQDSQQLRIEFPGDDG
jgi:hypothetical protein